MTYIPSSENSDISQDLLRQALQRQQALALVQPQPRPGPLAPPQVNTGGKGDFSGIEGSGANVGIMPPLAPPVDIASPEPAAAPEQPEQSDGPTDLTKLGDTANTPVAAAANPLDAALGEEPDTRPTGSFFGNPASSDALVAFGAAMLRAPNFNTGLADGAEAVGKAIAPYQMPTRADIARAALKAKFARIASGADMKDHSKGSYAPQLVQGDDGKNYFITPSKDGSGDLTFRDAQGNVTKGPNSWTVLNQTGIKEQNKLNVENLDQMAKSAVDADEIIARASSADKLYAAAGGGGGKPGEWVRAAQQFLGTSEADPQQLIQAWQAQALTMKRQGERGLGPLTDAESANLERQIASLAQNPKAFHTLLKAESYIARSHRDIYEAYRASDKSMSPREFVYQWRKDNNFSTGLQDILTANKSYEEDKPAAAAPAAPGAPTDLLSRKRGYLN